MGGIAIPKTIRAASQAILNVTSYAIFSMRFISIGNLLGCLFNREYEMSLPDDKSS